VTVSAQSLCPVSWLAIEPRHPALAGHFPGNPIVPGVVLLDHVIDVARQGHAPDSFVCRIPWVKFLEPVLPGQQVMLGLEFVSEGEARFTCRAGPVRVAEGVLAVERMPGHD
jgi:3-hydroxymyristoyl/3-hydroxydecanoyl-(acyl carrier protein) dehydratase